MSQSFSLGVRALPVVGCDVEPKYGNIAVDAPVTVTQKDENTDTPHFVDFGDDEQRGQKPAAASPPREGGARDAADDAGMRDGSVSG